MDYPKFSILRTNFNYLSRVSNLRHFSNMVTVPLEIVFIVSKFELDFNWNHFLCVQRRQVKFFKNSKLVVGPFTPKNLVGFYGIRSLVRNALEPNKVEGSQRNFIFRPIYCILVASRKWRGMYFSNFWTNIWTLFKPWYFITTLKTGSQC